jgi:4-alpha-glucanotransferase
MECLYKLAELSGAQLSYWDVTGQQRHAAPEALVPVLRAMGAPLEKIDDAPAALWEQKQALWREPLEPVTVAWLGATEPDAFLTLRVPHDQAGRSAEFVLRLETGEERCWACVPNDLPVTASADHEGIPATARRLALPPDLPPGYHRLHVELSGRTAQSTVLAAPVRAYEHPERVPGTNWGVFLPLYALHTEKSWGAGDFGDLEKLIEWVNSLGGGIVATLPLLAAFLDEPFEPGPYSPASRLFWNEFYLDLSRVPELAQSSAARQMVGSAAFQQEVAELRAVPLVDYRRQMQLKRRVLQELMRTLFARSSARRQEFETFIAGRPQLEDYARFRAVGEQRRGPWPTWPTALRDGTIREGDYDEEARRYHLYAQWLVDEQLHGLAERAGVAGPGLYLDLPLGVNPDSYDVWREREAFATGMAAGAPPDPFFAKGQNWGFPPLQPRQIRKQGYRYVAGYIRHHMRLAGVLRIDHMMGLHRLFWIPHGMDASKGVYVQYAADELYAVYCLESHRHRCALVGEDLGTVPPEVPPAMARHNVRRMYVLQYGIQPEHDGHINPVIPGSVASANTHDMPPFAAFLQGLDIQDRVDLGVLDPGVAEHERRSRQALVDAMIRFFEREGWLRDSREPQAILRACLKFMSAGPAMVVLTNLEDLWLETQPQNVPGTWRERPNWRRRAKYALEALRQLPEVLETLREMDRVTGASARRGQPQ